MSSLSRRYLAATRRGDREAYDGECWSPEKAHPNNSAFLRITIAPVPNASTDQRGDFTPTSPVPFGASTLVRRSVGSSSASETRWHAERHSSGNNRRLSLSCMMMRKLALNFVTVMQFDPSSTFMEWNVGPLCKPTEMNAMCAGG